MKRPVVCALLFLISGILLGRYASTVLFFVPLILILCMSIYSRFRYWPVFLFTLFALAGFWRIQNRLHDVLPVDGGTQTLTGIVTEAGCTASGNEKLTIRILYEKPGGRRINVNIMAYLRPSQHAEIGQSVTITGRLQHLELPSNPGTYHEFNYLRARKIDAKMYPDSLKTAETRTTLHQMLARINRRLAEVYDAALPEREASIMKSIILGDKIGLFDGVAAMYKQAGIYHILCISGLHVAILMLALNRLLGQFTNERIAGLIALGVMVFYCMLTGASVSTVRAVVMCGVMVFAKVLFRDYDLLASVSCACIALLLYEPLYLYDAGFQLSFGAVFGIAMLSMPIERALTLTRLPLPPRVRSALSANIAAVVATYPILSYHFYVISPYSVLVNMIVLPTASVLVVFGLLIGLAGLIWLPAAMYASGVVYYLLRFYHTVCLTAAKLPLSALRTGCCGVIICAAAYGLMGSFAYAFTGFGNKLRKRLLLTFVGVLLLIVCMYLRARPPGLQIAIPDMGRNACAVLRYNGYTFVVGDIDTVNLPEALIDYLDYINVRINDILLVSNETSCGKLTILKDNTEGAYFITLKDLSMYFGGVYNNKNQLSPPKADIAVLRVPSGMNPKLFASQQFDLTDTDIYILLDTPFYGSMPSSVTTALRGAGRTVYSIAEHGAVIFSTDGKSIRFAPFIQ